MKAILLDIMGVVFTEGHVIKKLREKIRDRLESQMEALYHRLKYQEIDREDFWVKLGVFEYEDFEREYLREFKVDAAFPEIVAYLKRKDYKLYVVTELPEEWVSTLISMNRLSHYFDNVFIANKMRMSKRHYQFYQYLMEKLKTKEIYFVDDNGENLRAAAKVGIKTILKAGKGESAFEPDYYIDDLTELKEIL